VIETSLGYYINPLVLTLFGFIFYKERLNRYQKIGIGLATLGVLVKTVLYGKLPIVALVLAVCFGSYGLLKKKSNLDSLTGLGFETLIIGIPSLIYMGIMEFGGNGITGNLPNSFWILISLSGIVTATPLLMYAESTKKLPLNVVGFLQYISPTIALMLGIFVFGEPFDIGSLIAFSLIWLGLGFFSYSQFKLLKR
jgi:chloramphenicol-sensitive protein RarD